MNISIQTIQSISTKFYHNENHLLYRILVADLNGDIYYRDFDKYNTYQQCHDELIQAYNEHRESTKLIDFSNTKFLKIA